MAIHTFLSDLFLDLPDNLFIQIWTLANKKSSYFTDIDKAEAYVKILKDDVFIGCGLSPSDLGAEHRCKANQIAGIPGFYIDIDYLDSVHKKSNLPPNIEAAIELACSLEYQPTLVVNSGHGLHAWWLFKEILVFDNNAERAQVAELERRLNYQIKAIAKVKGWEVDSVFDLSRVLRIPGTLNAKDYHAAKKISSIGGQEAGGDLKKKVEILQRHPDRRYNPLDFDDILDSIEKLESQVGKSPSFKTGNTVHKCSIAIQKVLNNIVFDPSATADVTGLEELGDIIGPHVIQTWDKKRKDFVDDSSASTWDMSLANVVAQANWSDQKILDLMVHFRRRHGHDLKLNNTQYYARTIVSARLYAAELKKNGDEQTEQVNEIETAVTTILNSKLEKIKIREQKLEIAKSSAQLKGVDKSDEFELEKQKIETSKVRAKEQAETQADGLLKKSIKETKKTEKEKREKKFKNLMAKYNEAIADITATKIVTVIVKEAVEATKTTKAVKAVTITKEIPSDFQTYKFPKNKKDLIILSAQKSAKDKNLKTFYDTTTKLLGFEILRIVHFLQENPFYYMTIRDPSKKPDNQIIHITYTDLDVFTSQVRHRRFLYNHLKHKPPVRSAAVWEMITDALGPVFIEQEDVAETTYHGVIKGILVQYLQEKEVLSRHQGLIENRPFKIGNEWCFYLEPFYKFATQTCNLDLGQMQTVNVLKGDKIEAKKFSTSVRIPDIKNPVSRAYWKIPDGNVDFPTQLIAIQGGKKDDDLDDDLDKELDDLDKKLQDKPDFVKLKS